MLRYLILFTILQFPILPAYPQVPRETRFRNDTLQVIHLPEALVTASENRALSTSSTLNRTAIEHVQPFSLADLMQLLPGGLTPEVSLLSPQYLRIRSSYSSDQANSLGTGIWLDGTKISNNTNLQLRLFGGTEAEQGQLGYDTRQLSLENIESVEIIRGIPSARYGDITSGAVLIHSRTKCEPLTFDIKVTPFIKALQAGRGWNTGTDGIINLFAGYTHTYADHRSHERSFHRGGLRVNWSERFRAATFNISLAGNFSKDAYRQEKDRAAGEYTRAKQADLSAHIYGSWQTNLRYLTSLDYRVAASYSRQYDKQRKRHTQMESIGTQRTIAGEDTAFFIPPNYYSLARLEGIPVSATMSLSAHLIRHGEQWRSHTSAGGEWNTEGNRGHGRTDDPTHPSGLWTRPRSYRDIPFLTTFAGYIEETFTWTGRAGILSAEAGTRFTSTHAGNERFSLSVEPRLNIRYSPASRLTLKAGWGRLRKLPTLSYLFPPPVYADRISFLYNDLSTGHRLAVITTDVIRQVNTSLSLPRNDKTELGFIFRFPGLEIDVTAFHEHLRKGFSLEDNVRPSASRIYQNDNIGGAKPEYSPEGVTDQGIPLPYSSDTTFLQYQRTANRLEQKKKGIEFTITTRQWNTLATTFIFDGLWLRTQEHTGGFFTQYQGSQTGGKSYPFAAIFANTQIRIYERLSTNFRMVTHIPFIRFISSLTLQSVWIDRNQLRHMDSNTPVYMKDSGGNSFQGNIYQDKEHHKYQNPLYYMDTHGDIHPFTAEMAEEKYYSSLLLSKPPRTYLKNSFRPYFLLNFRLTKEIGSHIRLTFYANNLTALNPSRYRASTGNYVTVNPSAFYGAELQLHF